MTTRSPNLDLTLRPSNIDDINISEWKPTRISASHSFNLDDTSNVIAMMAKNNNTSESRELMLKPEQMKQMDSAWSRQWNMYTRTKTIISAPHKKLRQQDKDKDNSECEQMITENEKDGADAEFKFEVELTERPETIVRGLVGPKDRDTVAELLNIDRNDIEDPVVPTYKGAEYAQYAFVVWKNPEQMINIYNRTHEESPGMMSYRPDNSDYDMIAQGSLSGLMDITNTDETLEMIRTKLDTLGETHDAKIFPNRGYAVFSLSDPKERPNFENAKFYHANNSGDIEIPFRMWNKHEPKSHNEITCIGMTGSCMSESNLANYKKVIERTTNTKVLYIEPGKGQENDRIFLALDNWEATVKLIKSNPQLENIGHRVLWMFTRDTTKEHSAKKLANLSKTKMITKETATNTKIVAELKQQVAQTGRIFSRTMAETAEKFTESLNHLDNKFNEKLDRQQQQMMALVMYVMEAKSLGDKKLRLSLSINSLQTQMVFATVLNLSENDKFEIQKQMTAFTEQIEDLEREEREQIRSLTDRVGALTYSSPKRSIQHRSRAERAEKRARTSNTTLSTDDDLVINESNNNE